MMTEPQIQVHIDYPEIYLQQDLYTKLLETPSLCQRIQNVLHLSQTVLWMIDTNRIYKIEYKNIQGQNLLQRNLGYLFIPKLFVQVFTIT